MLTRRKPFNPFYLLLVLVGIAFCLTAFTYGVMTVRGLRVDAATEMSPAGEQLMSWIDEHGFALMMAEVGALAILTFAAIAADEYWEKRTRACLTSTPPKNAGPDDQAGPRPIQNEESER